MEQDSRSMVTDGVPGALPLSRFHLQSKSYTPLLVSQELLKAVIEWAGGQIFREVDLQEQG